jgi:hypothetical protein
VPFGTISRLIVDAERGIVGPTPPLNPGGAAFNARAPATPNFAVTARALFPRRSSFASSVVDFGNAARGSSTVNPPSTPST